MHDSSRRNPQAQPERYVRARARARQRREAKNVEGQSLRRVLRVIVVLLTTLSSVAGIAAVGGLIAFNQLYAERVLFNVGVQSVDIGGLTQAEAEARLRQHYRPFLETPLTISLDDQTWQPTLAQVGVTLDLDTTLMQAYAAGRGTHLLQRVLQIAQIWDAGLDLSPQLLVDQRQLQDYLVAIARDVERPPRSASLSVVEGHVVSTTAQFGRQLLIDETAQDLVAALPNLSPPAITLRTRELHPLLEDTDIDAVMPQLTAMLREPLTLRAGERQWAWTPAEIGALVQLPTVPAADGSGEALTITLDLPLIEQRLQTLATEIDAAPVEPRLRFTNNGLEILREGHDGARLEVANAVDMVTGALFSGLRTIDLPITVLQPEARPDTLATLGIVELVAQGKSSFEASAPYRVTNIQAGARQIDGVLIPPGAEFSFNATIGAIDESNGFTKGYAIIDGRTQLEWGGGVCQVSTTVFRAAFWAGVPITERNQHSFRISWYEKFEPIGMDAAIFTGAGGYDLRFVNDTGAWLLLEAYADTASGGADHQPLRHQFRPRDYPGSTDDQ
jgi:hypothetical protein